MGSRGWGGDQGAGDDGVVKKGESSGEGGDEGVGSEADEEELVCGPCEEAVHAKTPRDPRAPTKAEWLAHQATHLFSTHLKLGICSI